MKYNAFNSGRFETQTFEKTIAEQAFLQWGRDSVTYVKFCTVVGREGYGVFSADGDLLEVVATPAEAYAFANDRDLEVHCLQ